MTLNIGVLAKKRARLYPVVDATLQCEEQCDESAIHSDILAMCAEAYWVVQSLPFLSVVSHAGHLNHTCSSQSHVLAHCEQCLVAVWSISYTVCCIIHNMHVDCRQLECNQVS